MLRLGAEEADMHVSELMDDVEDLKERLGECEPLGGAEESAVPSDERSKRTNPGGYSKSKSSSPPPSEVEMDAVEGEAIDSDALDKPASASPSGRIGAGGEEVGLERKTGSALLASI